MSSTSRRLCRNRTGVDAQTQRRAIATAPEFEVRSDAPVEVGLDGEAIVIDPPLRFRSLPGALRVQVPHIAGLAPAGQRRGDDLDEPQNAVRSRCRPARRLRWAALTGAAYPADSVRDHVDVESHRPTGPPLDESLLPRSLAGARSLARWGQPGRQLLAPVAFHLGRPGCVRGWPRTSGSRARGSRDCHRRVRCERPRKVARAPSTSILKRAAKPDPDAAVDIVSFRPQRGSIRVRDRREHEAAGAGADSFSTRRRGGILARLHGRSLPKRCRGGRRDRNRLGSARRALATAGCDARGRNALQPLCDHHFSSISSSRSSVSTSSSTLSRS